MSDERVTFSFLEHDPDVSAPTQRVHRLFVMYQGASEALMLSDGSLPSVNGFCE
jgi:hypothetical protein